MAPARSSWLAWLPRPYQLAGTRIEVLAAALCSAGLIAVFVADVLTPADVLLSSLALFPILFAVWTLSAVPAVLIPLLAGVLLTLEVLLGSADAITVASEVTAYAVLAIVTRLYARRIILSPPMPPPATPRRLAVLTRREREVIVLAAHGRTASEIADMLHIGERTVETHLANAYPKLGVRSKLELVKQATTLGV
ncbi:MAG TPA: helix-turn-helix transcriptional regulator [Candidatus Dormibacteraeota bacterium]|nr:helix-turn-helix transcriptional regulator [Candidatus Dormibacteraeota bacterium]